MHRFQCDKSETTTTKKTPVQLINCGWVGIRGITCQRLVNSLLWMIQIRKAKQKNMHKIPGNDEKACLRREVKGWVNSKQMSQRYACVTTLCDSVSSLKYIELQLYNSGLDFTYFSYTNNMIKQQSTLLAKLDNNVWPACCNTLMVIYRVFEWII